MDQVVFGMLCTNVRAVAVSRTRSALHGVGGVLLRAREHVTRGRRLSNELLLPRGQRWGHAVPRWTVLPEPVCVSEELQLRGGVCVPTRLHNGELYRVCRRQLLRRRRRAGDFVHIPRVLRW